MWGSDLLGHSHCHRLCFPSPAERWKAFYPPPPDVQRDVCTDRRHWTVKVKWKPIWPHVKLRCYQRRLAASASRACSRRRRRDTGGCPACSVNGISAGAPAGEPLSDLGPERGVPYLALLICVATKVEIVPRRNDERRINAAVAGFPSPE